MAADRLKLLTARRLALTAQSEALRARLLQDGAQAHRSLGVSRLAVSAVRSLGRNPVAVAAGLGILLAVGPRRALRAATGAVSAWFLLRRATRVAATLWRILQGR